MLRSLYSAVSGIKGHQTYLDVTGNNIANVNTTGFKKDSLQFADAIYQMSKSASAPNNGAGIGGVDPAQVGLGVSVAAIGTIHTQGSLQNTGQVSDMAISGSGFFVVNNGSQQLFTRAGNFALDRDGNLVMQGSGYMVQGYTYRDQLNPATGTIDRIKDTNLGSLNIPLGDKIPAKATQIASFRCNLCATESAELPNFNNIPGGDEAILRPHQYDTYAVKKATYIDLTGAADVNALGATGSQGATLLSGDDSSAVMYNWDTNTSTWVLDTSFVFDPDEIYYGTNVDTTGFGTIYLSSSGDIGPTATTRKQMDYIGEGAAYNDLGDPLAVPPIPPSGGLCVPPITKAGQTYLDSTTGEIYRANNLGNTWVLETTAEADSAYAAKYTFTAGSGVLNPAPAGGLFVADADPASDAYELVPGVLDLSSGTGNVFQWSLEKGAWININDTNLSPSSATVTTQATIDAFGDSIFASNDHVVKMTVYDSLGTPRTLEVAFRRAFTRPAYPDAEPNPLAAETEWDWYAYYLDDDGKRIESFGEGAGTMVFGDDGLLKRTYYYEPTPATPDPSATATSQPEYNWSVVEKIIGDPAYDNVVTGKVVADFNISGAQGSVVDGVPVTYESNTIILDFLGDLYANAMGLSHDTIDGVTQFSSETTTKMRYQDGYAMGTLSDWTVSQDGTIYGIYDNGTTQPLGQVAIATFANPGGLEKVGTTCFVTSLNSGAPQIGEPMSGGAGSIIANNLEMSNVDLSEEFVNLIRAQRGFQANSRVVTTSDQVLEELINLKR